MVRILLKLFRSVNQTGFLKTESAVARGVVCRIFLREGINDSDCDTFPTAARFSELHESGVPDLETGPLSINLRSCLDIFALSRVKFVILQSFSESVAFSLKTYSFIYFHKKLPQLLYYCEYNTSARASFASLSYFAAIILGKI